MISVPQKVVNIFGCCLAALVPSGLDAMRTKNHSTQLFKPVKQIRQLNKKSKQVLTYNQFLAQPGPITVKQLQKFSNLKKQQKTPIQEKYMGQLVPVFTGFKSPLFAILFASYFLVSQVKADLDPLANGMARAGDRMQQDAIGMANHYAFQAQMSATTARILATQQAEAQRLAQLKIQQDLDAQKLQLEQLKAEQKKHADEMLALEQKRLEEKKKLEELKKLEEQEAQEILKEQQKLAELKIKRLQEKKK